MSLGLWPDAVPFDPERGTASHDLSGRLDLSVFPPALLLVSGGTVRRSEWAGQAAFAVARAVAARGRRVVLADLDLDSPSLHELAGEANVEGITDVLLFGASLERVMIRPPGESFDLIAAGGFAPDAWEVLTHAGWSRILAELRSAGITLLGYLSEEATALEGIAGVIPTVVVLAEELQVPATLARLPETIGVAAMIRPAAPAPPAAIEPAAAEPSVEAPVDGTAAAPPSEPAPPPPVPVVKSEPAEPEPDAVQRAILEDVRARQHAASARSMVAEREPPGETGPPREAPVRRTAPVPKRKGSPWRWVAGVAVVAAVAAGAWAGNRYLRGGNTDAGGAAPASNVPAEPRGQPLAYSVVIESFDALSRAMARVDSLAPALPGQVYYIAPFEMEDATFYRVMAGPFADSGSAVLMMQMLVDAGEKAAFSDGDVRSTPLAFLLGAWERREEADLRLNELRESGVPSYIVEVPYTQGPPRYHLYAGAYSAPSEAAVLREVLRTRGIADTLVVRIGRVGS